MDPAWHDFTAPQGATFSEPLTYTDENDAPIDLTGCSAVMTITDGYGGALIKRLTSDSDGGITIDGPEGSLTLDISAEEMGAIEVSTKTGARPPQRVCVYNVDITFPTGVVERLVEGYFIVSRQAKAPA